MRTVASLIASLKEWSRPRRPLEDGKEGPFRLQCIFSGIPAEPSEIKYCNWDSGLSEFWTYSGSAELFKDIEYGQWGLKVYSPAEALAETNQQLVSREEDFRSTDRVVGSFFGDSDLLVLDTAYCSENGCAVFIALPIYSRDDWPKVANSFREFLEKLLLTQGDKYWEARSFRKPV